jgi:hypothetical protein
MTENIEKHARLGISSHVIHETIDAETIVINLATGTYYSLKGSAAEVWSLVARPDGIARHNISDVLSRRYGATRAELEAGLAPFLSELQSEDLVTYVTAPTGASVADDHAVTNEQGAPQEFVPPILEKFTDMQDLVLLDPVHEVDAVGWPQARPTGEAAADALAS